MLCDGHPFPAEGTVKHNGLETNSTHTTPKKLSALGILHLSMTF